MTDDAVEMMFSNNGNLQLGVDVGVAVGPLGRALEADLGTSPGKIAPIYTYSLSKGLYAGVSLDGKVIVTRNQVNERFYGREVSGMELLSGQIPTPPAARPLYDALQRCHVYATGNVPNRRNMMLGSMAQAQLQAPQHQNPSSFGEQLQFRQPQQFQSTYTPSQQLMYPTSSDMEYGELSEPIPYFPQSPRADSYAGMSDITSDPGY